MIRKIKLQIAKFKRELKVYQLVYTDPRTPSASKWFLGMAIAYALSPVDLIPDFIPLIGQLDDLVICPLLIFVALKMIPAEVLEDCRRRVV